eukprot:m.436119 g.436119  ORF g.436119 m.436119 type:complete len:69 (-) comp20266_c0_seq6:46-252(-)
MRAQPAVTVRHRRGAHTQRHGPHATTEVDTIDQQRAQPGPKEEAQCVTLCAFGVDLGDWTMQAATQRT